jgi:CheY-like chemotaxis protein
VHEIIPRILFVEDEMWFMEGLVDRLQAEGYEVQIERTATGALERLENEDFDVILLDIMVQPGDRIDDRSFGREAGVQLCKAVRDELKLDVPIVCLTVVTDKVIHEKLTAYGVERVLVKPTPNREVLSAIAEAIRA